MWSEIYSLNNYVTMLGDNPRMTAYVEALRRAVRPGCVILDLGAGLGVFALLAARFGARRVFAVDPSDTILVAREIAQANRLTDRIEFIQEFSTRVTLPEPADVVISDLRGVLPWFTHHLPSILDARKRLLAPGGALIPLQDTLYSAVVHAPELYDPLVRPCEKNPFALDLSPARRRTTLSWSKVRVRPEQLLTQPIQLASLDYTSFVETKLSAYAESPVTRAGIAHGFVVWFDSVLAPGVSFSNSPSNPELIYGSAFFPWNDPVPVNPGDRIHLSLRADLVTDDYIWRWDTTIDDGDSKDRPKAAFQQSTFAGVPLSAPGLRKRASSHVPLLSGDGCIDSFILGAMDGKTSLQEIVTLLRTRYPDDFPDDTSALNRVASLSARYSR